MTRSQPDARRPNIADLYQDLLAPLDENYRLSVIAQLAQGYYEGWRPTRRQLAAFIAEDTGQRRGVGRPIATMSIVDADIAAPVAVEKQLCPASAESPAFPSDSSQMSTSAADLPTQRRIRAAPPVVASFEIDCGELAPRSRFVARSLSTAGMVKRGAELCRLVFLNYELRPAAGPPEQPPSSPLIFTAPILCCPDQPVNWADDDGQDRHHAVIGNRVVARRGPWPLPATVQKVRFMISRQTSPGETPCPGPAGVLLVDISSGKGAWRSIPHRLVRQQYQKSGIDV